MARFENCIGFILDNEGGYSNESNDRPTNYGITDIDLADWRNVKSVTPAEVKAMLRSEALDIYRAWYWAPLHLDLVSSDAVATALLDIGVPRGVGREQSNYGKSIVATYAQNICNALGVPCAVDGKMGPKTAAAISKCDESKFITFLESRDEEGFRQIVKAKPGKLKFLKGWLRRARNLLTLIKTTVSGKKAA